MMWFIYLKSPVKLTLEISARIYFISTLVEDPPSLAGEPREDVNKLKII
jgi:hypothetical protein